MPRASNIKRFFSLMLVYLWGFTAPLEGYATGGDFVSQLDEMDLPEAHVFYIKQLLFERESECLSHGIDLQLEIDPSAIYRLLISDTGDRATVFHAVLDCVGIGNIWGSTSGLQTFVLVGDRVFVGWLAAPPQRKIIEGSTVLLFTLDASQCQTDIESVYDSAQNCFSILRWLPEKQQFYGYKSPINFVTSLN
tara:strand:- start:118 stop:696 length:579 start_codon:yes stop_codon:yes gene_type:complete